MSGQAGIYYFDSRPIEPSLILSFEHTLSSFGADETGLYQAPGVLLVHRAHHLTPEDSADQQPFFSSNGCGITWDGRLDNRRDLLIQLGADLAGHQSDAAIALAAYQRWESDAFRRLIGDWSLTIWDPHEQSITLARDFMGNRDLFYVADERYLAWSTNVETLRDYTSRHDCLDDDYFAGFLTIGPPPDSTPYRGIVALTPAHSLTAVRAGHVSKRRFWDLRCEPGRCRDNHEYTDRLLGHFTDGIAARLRARGPVWADLSGGFDSTPVVCVASALIRDQCVAAPSLETVTLYRPDSPESDERRFAEEVERFASVTGHHVACGDEMFYSTANPLGPAFSQGPRETCERLMLNRGARVFLSGRAGDAVMAHLPDNRPSLADSLSRWEPVEFTRDALAWSRKLKRPLIETLYRACLPFAPVSVQEHCWRFKSPSARPDYRKTHSLGLRLTDDPLALHPNYTKLASERCTPGQIHIVRALLQYLIKAPLKAAEVSPLVAYTYPFSHRPLIEFVTSVPPEVLSRPGVPRALMKDAFAAVFPPKILRRQSKGYTAPAWGRGFRPRARDLFSRVDSLRTVEMGLIDAGSLRSRLQQVCDGSCTELGNLPLIALLEDWLTAVATKTLAA